MKKRITDIAIIAVGIVFLCWYFPVAFFNVYACDDYWFGNNVRNNGFWGNQLFYYLYWEGSYTHTFFASLPHVLNFTRTPFLGNIFSLGLLFWSLFAFLKTYTTITFKRCLVNTLYLLSFLYLCTNGGAEIRFWICANVSYLSEISFLLLLLSLYHNLKHTNAYKTWGMMILLLCLVGGSKLTIILYATSGLIIHDIIFEETINKKKIAVFIILTIFLFVNVCSPGNYIRLEEETMHKEFVEQMSLAGTIKYRLLEMKYFFLNLLFLLPIASQWRPKYVFKEKRVLMVLATFLLTFILDGVIMYACFNDSGPLRVYFVAEVSLSILAMFILNHIYWSVLSKYRYKTLISVLFSIMIVLSHIPILLQLSDSIEYANLARERDRYVASCKSDDKIVISPLPPSHLLLSYFANDEIWLERVYLPYFQKKGKVVLLEQRESH